MRLSNVPAVLCLACMAAACSGGGPTDDSGSGNSGGNGGGIQDIALEPTFSSIQTNLFSTICVACHSGSNPPQGLSLEADQSYGLLVDVPSSEVPTLDRVEPGDPDNSYIIHKLEGTAAVGLRMPASGPPYLTAAQIAVIRQWISDGAIDDRATLAVPAGLPADSFRVVAVSPQPDAVLQQAPAYATLAMNRPVDASLVNGQTVKVIASGGDGTFGDGNEYSVGPVTIEVSLQNPGLVKVDLGNAKLAKDDYCIVMSDNGGIAVSTIGGAPLDGDGDGVPGGKFVSHFSIL